MSIDSAIINPESQSHSRKNLNIENHCIKSNHCQTQGEYYAIINHDRSYLTCGSKLSCNLYNPTCTTISKYQ